MLAILAVLVLPGPARGQIGFAENEADRIRVWNADYYELAFRKADGRLLSMIDKTTGQEVSPGNVHGPWVMRFSNGSWLDGQDFSPTNASRMFTYAWDAQAETLTLNYAASGSTASHVSILIRPTAGPEVDTALTVDNQSGATIELMAYPVQLSFRRSQIDAVYVPYIEGMRLTSNFFSSYEFVSSYPGQLFGDFAYTDLTSGSFAVYGLHDPAAPLKASDWLILRDDSYAGGVSKYHHDYELAVPPGASWQSAVTVLSVGSSLETAMADYWTRSGHEAMPTLAEKLGPSLFEKLTHAVLLKRDFLQGSWTFASFQTFLQNLPANNLIHIVAFWPNGFDENYPDYLPPSSALGTQTELQNLVATARAGGHLVMPYTNPTWWDDQSPTLAALGTGIAARDRNGNPIYENYGSHGGYVVSPHAPEVIARQDQTRDEFTLTVPCDLMFEDQVGARGPTYDGHASSPDPMRYTQGLIDVAARSAMSLPIMSEGGFDRLAWVESGFCNSHTIGWHWWPSSTYQAYPMAQLWAHENLYFSVHNLAGTTMTVDLPALTYHLSMGYSLAYDLSALNAGWLNVVDRYQKHLVSSLVGRGMVSFERLTPEGLTRTVYGDGTVVTANLTASTRAHDDHVIAANGFIAEKDGRVRGGVFTELHGENLAGASPHYLIFEYTDQRIVIHQPRGDNGTLAVPRPVDWVDDGRILASAVTTTGGAISQPVTFQPGALQVEYFDFIAGQPIARVEIAYCRTGDTDCDGDVDSVDYAVFVDCLAGPSQVLSPTPPSSVQGCLDAFDGDGDSDIDLADFAMFQGAFTGSD